MCSIKKDIGENFFLKKDISKFSLRKIKLFLTITDKK